MHVLLSPGRFDRPVTRLPAVGGTADWSALGAIEVARALAAGWHDARPDDRLDLLPLNDGGPGLIDVVRLARGGELVALTVPDAGGARVPSAVLVLPEDSGARTAYVDGSVALAGRAPVDRSSTAGLGELVRAALNTGAQRIVIGTGPRQVTAHDGGWGLLRVLLGESDLPSCVVGEAWMTDPGMVAELSGRFREFAESYRDRDLVVLGTHDLTLLGLNGASAALVSAGRVTVEQAQVIERQMADLVACLTIAAGPARASLLGGTSDQECPVGSAATASRAPAVTRPAVAPGSGAGGGAAVALGLLGARRVNGASWVADAVRLVDRIEAADLVVTGTGVLDGAALDEGVIPAVSAAALPRGIPLVALAAELRTGRRDWGAAGVAGAFGVIESPEQIAAWQAGPAAALRARVPRVARTWSR